jgi:hypothetical protein
VLVTGVAAGTNPRVGAGIIRRTNENWSSPKFPFPVPLIRPLELGSA